MAHRVFRWSRLLPITALLVITTGVAAAPIRNAWLPIVARPFGFNLGAMPAGAPTLSASDATTGGNVRRDNVELEATLTNAPDRLQMLASSTSHTSESSGRRSELTLDTSVGQAWARNHQRGNSSSGSLIGSGGFGGSIGSGGLLGSRAAPSAGPPLSYARTETRNNGNGLTRLPSANHSGGGNGAAPGSNSGGGSGGGHGGGGSAPGNNPGIGFPVGSGPIGGSTTADGIFADHTSGLPELGGNHSGSVGGSDNGGRNDRIGPTLAANPEPSSILLFGTGLVAVAGAVRRRFRR